MDLQQPSAVMIDLGKLPSTDGNGQEPDRRTHSKLEDAEMLKLLEGAFNKDNALVQKWGTQFMFVGSLPRGYGYWEHMTTSRKVPPEPPKSIKETYGHPHIAGLRSGPELFRHVLEIMDANEFAIRNLISHDQPTNPTNNARISIITANNAVVCNCPR